VIGYQIKFFTQQNREHGGMPISEWILEEARQLGIRGATVQAGEEGFGHDGRFHSDNYFDFVDRPLQVVMALTPEEYTALFARIRDSGVNVFYTKTEIEFGFTLYS